MMSALLIYVLACAVCTAALVSLWGPPSRDKASTVAILAALSPVVIILMAAAWLIEKLDRITR